jgi:hypothetical protein
VFLAVFSETKVLYFRPIIRGKFQILDKVGQKRGDFPKKT